jgi:hypothetical protein
MPDALIPPARAVAHVNVVRGATPQHVPLLAGLPAHLTIGSGPQADLRIEQADVAPRQLDCAWDGHGLWVQDALRLGRTFVNGRTLNEWVPVEHHVIVSFGGVRLWMRGPQLPAGVRSPDLTAIERHHSGARAPVLSALRRHDTGRITVPPELLGVLSGANGRLR